MISENKKKIPLTKLLEAVLPHQVTVYVTVLNIIQCIAFAFLINEGRETVATGELNLIWTLRSATALTIIFVVWHRYISEMQYLWPISWSDTLAPFFIGIIECWIVFATNPKTTSLNWFIVSVALLQLFAFFAYGVAYSKRKNKGTESLYQNFYEDYPQFASYLMGFLKSYDKWHIFIFATFFWVSIAFLILTIFVPKNFVEMGFSTFYLFGLTWGEYRNNFQKALQQDRFVGPYFQ